MSVHPKGPCRNGDCHRPFCEGYRLGYGEGREDGYRDGYGDGFPDGIAACPREHK